MSDIADSLLDVNNLDYGMPPIPSIATGRTQISVFPQTVSSSSGGNVIFNVSSGSQFISGPNSYIDIKLKITGGDADTSINSVAALFDNVVITAQNGVEVCRVNEFGMYIHRNKWKVSKNTTDILNQVVAYNRKLTAADQELKLILRLDNIPFFKNKNLLPPQLMEGLRIQLKVNPVGRAFKTPGAAVTGFEITPILKLDAVTLADTFLRRVNEISSSAGLVLMHEEPFHFPSTSSSANLNIAINKACSKATEFVLTSRLVNFESTPLEETGTLDGGGRDSFSTEPYNFSSIQLQAGSQYYPIQPLTQESASLEGSTEPYYYTLINLAPDLECSVSYTYFYRQFNGHTSCEALFGQDLKEGNGGMTGILLNNSRSLLVNAKLGDAQARVFTSYLSHIRLVRVFQNTVVVRD
jgi:hypothetical protein